MGFRGNHLSPWFVVSLLLSLAIIAQSSEKCMYTIYIKTGCTIGKGCTKETGMQPKIGVILGDGTGDRVNISNNIVTWGHLAEKEPGQVYFKWESEDVFSGPARCLKGPVCFMKLFSDESHETTEVFGWFCKYVVVTMTGVTRECSKQSFPVDEWLCTLLPNKLSVERDECKSKDDGVGNKIDR